MHAVENLKDLLYSAFPDPKNSIAYEVSLSKLQIEMSVHLLAALLMLNGDACAVAYASKLNNVEK